MLNKQIAQAELINEIACGDSKLRKVLADSFDDEWRVACFGVCVDKLKYLYAERGLIGLAQKFVADRVDESHRRSNNDSQDDFTSTSWRDSSSRREAAGNRCSWTQATSFQQFQDDRAARQRDDSIAWSEMVGTFWDTMSDRSTRDACGWTRASATSKSQSKKSGTSKSSSKTSRKSRSGASTGPMAGLDGAFFNIVPPTYNGSVDDPGWTFHQPASTVATRADSPCGGVDANGNSLPCQALPNYSRSYVAKTSITESVDILYKSISIGFEVNYGRSVKQTHICSSGTSCVTGASTAESKSAEKSESDTHNLSNVSDFTSDQHDVHRAGETHRSSEAHLGSLSQSVMRAHGERHTGSDSSGHAQAQSAGEAESQSKHHSEGREVGFSNSDFSATADYWNQISKALADLWKRVNDEIETLKRRLAASMMPATASYCDVDHMRKLACDKDAYDKGKVIFMRGIPRKNPLGF